ncbi:MAG TPA: hypothetical protein VFI02_19780 [Armatimonadota bacterium]|nr:hypothetical protein [Armatimonadota bacterium]
MSSVIDVVLSFLVDGIKWAVRRPRLAVEGLLVVALLLGGWKYNRALEDAQRARDEHAQLEEGLREKITLKDNELEIIRRENGKVTVERIYVPPEGSIVIKRKDHEAQMVKYKQALGLLEQAVKDHGTESREANRLRDLIRDLRIGMESPGETVVENKGFVLRPGFGLEVGRRGVKPRLDLKLAYWHRYSVLAGGSEYGLGVGASRHLDDWVWLRPKNVEWYVEYKPLRFDRQDWIVTSGLRANF